MRNRSFAPLVFGPVLLFIGALALVAAFVTHPPTLGWVGLGLLAAALLGAGAVIFAGLLRTRTNAQRLHPHEAEVHRLLVVMDTDVEPEQLCLAVLLHALARRIEVRVVAPVMATPLHFLAGDEELDRREATHRLEAALRALDDVGIHAQGAVGTDDPLQAVGDVLPEFPADEIMLVAALPSRRTWEDRDAERQLRDLFGVPVSTSYGRPRLPPRAAPRLERPTGRTRAGLHLSARRH